MFRDLIDASEPLSIEGDICIIGSGPAALSVALEFQDTNTTVMVLEAGGDGHDADTQALHDLTNLGHPIRGDTPIRYRQLGGTASNWGGGWKILDPIDFEKREWIPYSGWPIPYQEVERYWAIAADRYNLPPLTRYRPEHWLPAVSMTEDVQLFHPDTCISVKTRTHPPLNLAKDPTLRQSRNIQVYLHANVTQLVVSDSFRSIDEVHARSLPGQSLRCRAKVFVVAAGGIENAGLLLNSRDKTDQGIGNVNGLVCRF